MNRAELFESYYSTLWQDIHGDKNFESIALGYEESYGQCLPEKKEAFILDFGCGMGHCLYYLKQKGYINVMGLEVSPQMAKIAAEKTGVPVEVVADSVEYLSNHKEAFDCIVMNDVIEHLTKGEIIPQLKAIHAALKSGGGRCMFTRPESAGSRVWSHDITTLRTKSFLWNPP